MSYAPPPPPPPRRRAAADVLATKGGAEEPQPRWQDRRVGLAAAVAVTSGLFVLVRTGAAAFYEPLGVTPEDVGAGYPDLLVQGLWTVLFLAALGFISAVAYIGLGSAIVFVACLWRRAAQPGDRWRASLALAFAVPLAVLLAVTNPVRVFVLLLAGGVFCLWAGSRFNLARSAGPAVTLVAVAVAVVALDLSPEFARVNANAARHGVAPTSALLVPERPWRAEVGTVSWDGERPARLVGVNLGCVLLLGPAKDGTLVFATDRAGQRRTFVAGDDAFVQRLPDTRECDWPDPLASGAVKTSD